MIDSFVEEIVDDIVEWPKLIFVMTNGPTVHTTTSLGEGGGGGSNSHRLGYRT